MNDNQLLGFINFWKNALAVKALPGGYSESPPPKTDSYFKLDKYFLHKKIVTSVSQDTYFSFMKAFNALTFALSTGPYTTK